MKTWRTLTHLLFGWWHAWRRRKRAEWPAYRLAVGRYYTVAMKPEGRADLPLMPALTLEQMVLGGQRVRALVVGVQFKVLKRVRHPVDTLPWWKVKVTSGQHARAVGMLNGAAFMPKGRIVEC